MSLEEQPLLRNQTWSPFEETDETNLLENGFSNINEKDGEESRYLRETGVMPVTSKKTRLNLFSSKNAQSSSSLVKTAIKNNKNNTNTTSKIRKGSQKHQRKQKLKKNKLKMSNQKIGRKNSLISMKSTMRWTKGLFQLNSTTLPEPGLYTRHFNDEIYSSSSSSSSNNNAPNSIDDNIYFDEIPYEIQYSVFRATDKPLHSTADNQSLVSTNSFTFSEDFELEKIEFLALIQESIYTIQNYRIQPLRIQQGSSGSYFVYGRKPQFRDQPPENIDPNQIMSPSGDYDNRETQLSNEHIRSVSSLSAYPEFEILGVFKPKDEEPYGPLSPKWTKWLHRTFFPWFFGRTCLIPNLGYICESAASLLDKKLNIDMVPFTDTVVLDSSSFYPKKSNLIKNFFRKHFLHRSTVQLQRKVGSYQLFLQNYMNANDFFDIYPLPGMRGKYSTALHSDNEAFSHQSSFIWSANDGALLHRFRLQLEKLIILDYLMRNTDRGFDNWMIKMIKDPDSGNPIDIKIAAIDNALAFPWKHPDEWRSFPYGWLYLPINILNVPFHKKTREHFLQILTDVKWWEETFQDLTELFSRDSEFKMRLWEKQWSVLKGQAFNIVETLKSKDQGPLQLVRRTRCVVVDEHMKIEIVDPAFFKNLSSRIDIGGKGSENKSRTIFGIGTPELLNPPRNFTSPMKLSYESTKNVDESWRHLLNGEIDEQTWVNQATPVISQTEVGRENNGVQKSGKPFNETHVSDEAGGTSGSPRNTDFADANASFLNFPDEDVSAKAPPLRTVNKNRQFDNPFYHTEDDLGLNVSAVLPNSVNDVPSISKANSAGLKHILESDNGTPNTNEFKDTLQVSEDEDDEEDEDFSEYHDAVESSRDYQSISSIKPKTKNNKKTVIIERLKLVTSKPPVFTWW